MHLLPGPAPETGAVEGARGSAVSLPPSTNEESQQGPGRSNDFPGAADEFSTVHRLWIWSPRTGCSGWRLWEIPDKDTGAREHVHGGGECGGICPLGLPGGPEPCVPGTDFAEDAGGGAALTCACAPGPYIHRPTPSRCPFTASHFSVEEPGDAGETHLPG